MKEMFEKINVTEAMVILICGIALVLSIFYENHELAMALGGGLVGYLGGVTTGGGRA